MCCFHAQPVHYEPSWIKWSETILSPFRHCEWLWECGALNLFVRTRLSLWVSFCLPSVFSKCHLSSCLFIFSRRMKRENTNFRLRICWQLCTLQWHGTWILTWLRKNLDFHHTVWTLTALHPCCALDMNDYDILCDQGHSLAKLTKAPTNQKTTKLQTSQTNNTSAGQSILHKQHKSRRQHNKMWQRDSSACSSTFMFTDKETTPHSAQRRTLKRNRHHVSYSTFCWLEPNFVTKAKRKLDMRELCVRGEEVERELTKRRRVGSSFEGLSTDTADSAAKNLHSYKAHKSVVSHSTKVKKHNKRTCNQVKFLLFLISKKICRLDLVQSKLETITSAKPKFLAWDLLFTLVETQPPTILTAFPSSLMMDCLWESLDQVIPEIQKISPVKVKQWVFENPFFAFLNFWLCFVFFPIFDCFLFFLQTFPFGWVVGLTFVVTKWWTTFFVKEHRSTKLKQLESIFLLNIMANQQWTHTFLTFLVLWVNGLWPSTLQTSMTSKRRLLRHLSSPKLQWQKK